MNDVKSLSTVQAYRAMLLFLEQAYELTRSDALGGLLGGWQLTAEGETMDPAAWADWLSAVQSVLDVQTHDKL